MPDSTQINFGITIRPNTERDAISAVNFSERLTADIDAWAEARGSVRSDAIRQLVQLGLSATSPAVAPGFIGRDSVEPENLAVKQIDRLLDPSLPSEERDRRIRRLTEGPPEFSAERIDLPLRK